MFKKKTIREKEVENLSEIMQAILQLQKDNLRIINLVDNVAEIALKYSIKQNQLEKRIERLEER